MKRASVGDVSRRAGVSTATVSRVLNDPDKVTEATRDKVLAAIKELNFVKNATAFSLKAQRSHNVLVVVSNIGNIFYSKMFQGVQRRAEANGYSVIITSRTGSPDHTVLERLRTGRVDGVLILDPTPLGADDLAFITSSYSQTPPIVGFSEVKGLLPYPHVFVDNFQPSYDLTRYLIGLGHRRIGVVQAPDYLPVRKERLGGYLQAMHDAGIEIRDEDIFDGGFESPAGHNVARALLERGRDRMPTAMMCSNDEMAMGMISDLVQAGIKVPEDISAIGFDDSTLADVYSPPLTTVAQPREQIGREAMDLLLRILADPSIPSDSVVALETTACIRGTTAPPRMH